MSTSQNPGLNPKDFRTALDIAMATKGINERELGALLGLSQQSISKWWHRGFPPLYRVNDLKAVFGPDSNIGRMDFSHFAKDVVRLWVVAPPNVPDAMFPRVAPTLHRDVGADGQFDPLAAVRAWRSEQESHLMYGLPGGLRPNLTRALGGTAYESPALAVGVVLSARGPVLMPERVSDRALRLLAARATGPHKEQKLAVAIVMGDVPPQIGTTHLVDRWPRVLKNLTEMFQAVGVTLWVFHTGTEIAQAICEVEGVAFEQPETQAPEESEE